MTTKDPAQEIADTIDREALGALLNANWTHHVVTIFSNNDTDEFARRLNEYGAKGWELVACFQHGTYPKAIFKKRVVT